MYRESEKGILLFLIAIFFVGALFFAGISYAQSDNPLSPTWIVSNSIAGEIKARDVGDPRLTTFYYVFNGKRGDIFINVWSKNLGGDIEVFTASSLKSRTKILCYADVEDSETGRVIYMRKPETLILRIQGRPPNDDPATFRVKFAGSFVPMVGKAKKERGKLPEFGASGRGSVEVNSVGTIVGNKKKDSVLLERKGSSANVAKNKYKPRSEIPASQTPQKKSERKSIGKYGTKSPLVIIPNPLVKLKEDENDLIVELKEKSPRSAIVTIEKVLDNEDTFESQPKKNTKMRLVIELKNGSKFISLMSKVVSVNLLDRVLKVVTTDGSVKSFPIFELAKMTID